MQNFLILRELQTEFLKFKIHFAKISYKEYLIKKTECTGWFLYSVPSLYELGIHSIVRCKIALNAILLTFGYIFYKNSHNFGLD